ncbi:MAG: hypothetical protein MRQ13_02555 [Candidatus Midichloria sp.]|nr:hypothetical protein [Candidatus Midichloria sp.]
MVSVLVNGNNNFSAMVNTENGEGVLSGTYYEAVQVPVTTAHKKWNYYYGSCYKYGNISS